MIAGFMSNEDNEQCTKTFSHRTLKGLMSMTTNFKRSTDFSVTKKKSLKVSLKSRHSVNERYVCRSTCVLRFRSWHAWHNFSCIFSKLGYIFLPLGTTVDLVWIDVVGAGEAWLAWWYRLNGWRMETGLPLVYLGWIITESVSRYVFVRLVDFFSFGDRIRDMT